MSLFGHLFKSRAMPLLFNTFGDDGCDLIYRIGTKQCTLQGIKRHEADEIRWDNERGINRKVRVCQIVISKDPAHPWGGLPDPQLTATWEIREQGQAGTTWSVDTEQGKGVESISEAQAVINLIRTSAAAIASPGIYRQ